MLKGVHFIPLCDKASVCGGDSQKITKCALSLCTEFWYLGLERKNVYFCSPAFVIQPLKAFDVIILRQNDTLLTNENMHLL